MRNRESQGDCYEKEKLSFSNEEDILIDLTFYKVSASLEAEFKEKIADSYYNGNLNAAFQDLVQKALSEQDFVLSHITHVRDCVET